MLRRKTWTLLVIACGLSITGCATPCHTAIDRSLAPHLLQDLPCGTQRHRVQVVIINGFDPLHIAHIEGLRDKLNACGFAKVSVGEWFHAHVLESELAKIRCEEPETRVVVVGFSTGAGAARGLCSRIVANGGSVDALIELAPVYVPLVNAPLVDTYVGRRVVVSSQRDGTCDQSPNSTHVAVPGVTHYSVPNHDASVAVVLQEVRLVAASIPQLDYGTGPTLPLVDNPAPMPSVIVPPTPTTPPTPKLFPNSPNLITQPTPSLIPPNTVRAPNGTLTSGTLR